MSIPNDFPQFSVPGYVKEMKSLRALYWLHYPTSNPKATLWDMWLVSPALWPAVETDGSRESMRMQWSDVLSNRILDNDGYVSVHQHISIAHPLGWPFPVWYQGEGGYSWDFSINNATGSPGRKDNHSNAEGWILKGCEDAGTDESGWNLKLTEANALITFPAQPIDTFQSPFIQVRWFASGLGNAQPYIEWTTKDAPEFSSERRFYFNPVESADHTYTVIPLYKHPGWKGQVTRLRLGFDNKAPASVTLQAVFTQYDTRHNINSQCFVKGCSTYFWWTRDLNFLRRNINRMRTAMRFVMTEHKALKENVVCSDWVGHDGKSGIKINKDGTKELLSGRGIGDNYWDLLPFGAKDFYASVLYYAALKAMAQIERDVRANPGWNVPLGALAFDPDMLESHAEKVKAVCNKLFWNDKTGRFVPNTDADGNKHDYGFTFLNLEAIHYGFATPEHARSIMSWINGERIVEGDTSTGKDIYHWRFAPRATCKRNVDYYLWAWSGPEAIPWGGQVQDGGAVLGFSYHDLMARLATNGPDDAWTRLQEIIKWFDEVQAAGGYRKYYDGKSREGTLQGGGTAGGLGLDFEFVESVLVPQIMLDGFMGFEPMANGFKINPRLPSSWPELAIDRIRWHDQTLRIRATGKAVEVLVDGADDEPCFIRLPEGDWKAAYIGKDGKVTAAKPSRRVSDGAFEVNWTNEVKGVRFER